MRWLMVLGLIVTGAVSCRPVEKRASPSISEIQSAVSVSPPLHSIALPSNVATISNTKIASFGKAKKHLWEIHKDHQTTLYCGCAYEGNELVSPPGACGYVPITTGIRSRRVEWEHVVPAQAFGQSFREWREGHPECVDGRGKPFRGRPCARKVAVAFRYMEADMYNLQPAIGDVNDRRGTATPAMIPGENRLFGTCDFEVSAGKFEPRPEVRGDIARTYLYMDMAYPGRGILSEKNKKLFEAWSDQDPVDAWECERARRIARIQGNINQVVERACRQAHR
ncbi:MAG TPA: endonuclease [Polyangiaceae bacterium]|nr:MAG: Nuclease NucM precursor [Deltaproteobacteria bacterium ADurb.Bin207]HNS99327.1 endonuclease [Polyangiaceae bacterium]HNZ20963.1 endonuclease [Polyangiaceae bacterium]HOD24008.1 endonuclease [Polyangiaceae bacterium]HOE48875.1 endonuclease [Polyangiaceae bacterium]